MSRKDLASLRPQIDVVIDSVPLKMVPPSLANLVEVQRWLDQQPSPREQYRAALDDPPPGAPEETLRALSAEVFERSMRWPPRFGSIEANNLLVTIEGAIVLAAAMLRTGQPHITHEYSIELAGKLGLEDLNNMIRVAFGADDDDAPAIDPKARPGDSGPGSTPPIPSTGP